jgi:glucokinase
LIQLALVDKDGYLYNSVNGDVERLNYSYMERGYLKGDAACTALWTEVKDLLSMAIANMVTVFNPDCVVIGGGAISNTPRLLKAVIEDIKRFATPPSLSILNIRKAVLGDDAGMIGAALLAKNYQIKD